MKTKNIVVNVIYGVLFGIGAITTWVGTSTSDAIVMEAMANLLVMVVFSFPAIVVGNWIATGIIKIYNKFKRAKQ